MAEIRLSGVNKVYPGGTHAVHDVDLHIADGEFMIMVGPSGCAKSTILRMIAGLETPTGGTIEIGGRVVNDVAPKDRDIAMVFQSYALYPHMTVRENMAFGLRLRRMPPTEIDQRVADAARILGLESLLDRLPKAMSGGQRQRVAMGRAIVREPQAFLMDEPLSNLDAKLRVQMRTEIAKLHQRLRTTTVYVTHDQVEAMTLGQRICILRKGVVQQVDTPFQVYQNPANVFVGGFMGSPGMNFMNGHLVLHEGILYLQLGEQHLPVPASVSARLLASTDLHGRGVIVGIRPEHLSMTSADDPGGVPVRVELTEVMGAEVYAYFTAGVTTPDLTALSDTQATADTFVARLAAGTETQGGQQIALRPDLDEVHLFDPQTMLTMLAPADEGEVRERQRGAAITIASGVGTSAPSPVASPPNAATGPGQQVLHMPIHLHQTFVQSEAMTQGTLPDADPSTIAAVFDQPLVPSGMQLEPLLPTAVSAGYAGGAPSVTTHYEPAFQVARPADPGEALPRPAFARGVAAGSTWEATPAAEPVVAAEPGPGEPAEPPAAEAPAAAPTAERPRGFAPRVIGATPRSAEPEARPEPEPSAHIAPPTEIEIERDEQPSLSVTETELDAAIGSLTIDAGATWADAEATEPPSPDPVAVAPQASPSPFRMALERVRAAAAPAPVGPVDLPGATLSPLSLRAPSLQLAPAVANAATPETVTPSTDSVETTEN